MPDTTTAYDALARGIADHVGGPENVRAVTACTTRLRFELRDDAAADLDALNETPGVMRALRSGGQVQVVIGAHVDDVRRALVAQPGWSERGASGDGAGPAPRQSVLDAVFGFLGGTFQPLIAPITGAAMVQVVALLLTQFGVLAAEDPTAQILTAAGNAIFFFLPVFVAFTASQKLGVNPFVGAAIAAALLHPAFTGIGEAGTVAQAFGLPLFLYSYASSMFPALLVALALAGLDRVLRRLLPRALQQVFVPTLELLLLVPLTAMVFGPIGVLVGQGMGAGIGWLSANAHFVFYLVLPAVWVALVAFGIHWAVISLAIAELASAGTSDILGAAMGYQYAMFGVALGMLVRTIRGGRAASLRGTATAAALAVGIGGITEPTLYGFVLRYRKVLLIEVIAAMASGAVLGIVNATATGFSPAPILGLPLMVPTLGALLAMAVALAVPVVLIQTWGFEPRRAALVDATGAPPASEPVAPGSVAASSVTPGTMGAPMAGVVRSLAATGDAVFAGGLIGPGVAIEPSGGRVVAPTAGVVVAVPETGHAIGLRTDAGLELLVHVGIDTVQLRGAHLVPRVEQGQRVEAGQVLLEFDAAGIAGAGFSTVTPVVITNAPASMRVETVAEEGAEVREGAPLLRVVADEA